MDNSALRKIAGDIVNIVNNERGDYGYNTIVSDVLYQLNKVLDQQKQELLDSCNKRLDMVISKYAEKMLTMSKDERFKLIFGGTEQEVR